MRPDGDRGCVTTLPARKEVCGRPSHREIARIKSTLARLEEWQLIHGSTQRGPSPESSQNFHPKRYLFDTGVLRDFREQALPSIGVLDRLDSAPQTPGRNHRESGRDRASQPHWQASGLAAIILWTRGRFHLSAGANADPLRVQSLPLDQEDPSQRAPLLFGTV